MHCLSFPYTLPLQLMSCRSVLLDLPLYLLYILVGLCLSISTVTTFSFLSHSIGGGGRTLNVHRNRLTSLLPPSSHIYTLSSFSVVFLFTIFCTFLLPSSFRSHFYRRKGTLCCPHHHLHHELYIQALRHQPSSHSSLGTNTPLYTSRSGFPPSTALVSVSFTEVLQN